MLSKKPVSAATLKLLGYGHAGFPTGPGITESSFKPSLATLSFQPGVFCAPLPRHDVDRELVRRGHHMTIKSAPGIARPVTPRRCALPHKPPRRKVIVAASTVRARGGYRSLGILILLAPPGRDPVRFQTLMNPTYAIRQD